MKPGLHQGIAKRQLKSGPRRFHHRDDGHSHVYIVEPHSPESAPELRHSLDVKGYLVVT